MKLQLIGIALGLAFVAASMGAARGADSKPQSAAPSSGASPGPTASPSPSSARPSPNHTASEKAGKKKTQKLPPVVVTATRIEQPISEIGATVTVVNDDQIESQKIQSLENVLRQVPGVVVTQSGSPGTIADVAIRGSTPAQTLVMVDGV